MIRVFEFPTATRRDEAVEAWFNARPDQLGAIALTWFELMRECGEDVRELLHDGHPTACVGEIAFGYVNAFSAHVNVGFFAGAELPDPAGILEGRGKFMRHVKLRPQADINIDALKALIKVAYSDIKLRQQI